MKPVTMIAGTSFLVASLTAVGIMFGLPALTKMNDKNSEDTAIVGSNSELAQAAKSLAAKKNDEHREHRRLAERDTHEKTLQIARACVDCGVVQAVREIKEDGAASGGGAVVGGIAGAILGHQIGHGQGKDVATVAGAVGGALLGNTVEKKVKGKPVYEITVRNDAGDTQVIRQDTQVVFQEGEPVRIVDGRVVPR